MKTYTKNFNKLLLLTHLRQIRGHLKKVRYACFKFKCWTAFKGLRDIYGVIEELEGKIKFKQPSDMDLYRYKRKLECIKRKGLVGGFSDRLAYRADEVINQVIENVELRVVKNGNQRVKV